MDRETDLNTFITQWREATDTDIHHSVHMCQIAENIIRSMQDKLGEAKAMYDREKEVWCNDYIKVLRGIELEKFDEISARVFEFMDVHTKLSPEQIAKNMENAKRGGKGDQTRMDILHMVAPSDDILFGIWANVLSRNQYGYDIKFGNHMCQLPQKQASTQIVLRTLWTSYDYLTPHKIQNDFVVGGIVDFQMY